MSRPNEREEQAFFLVEENWVIQDSAIVDTDIYNYFYSEYLVLVYYNVWW
jgi:hypothetical protein